MCLQLCADAVRVEVLVRVCAFPDLSERGLHVHNDMAPAGQAARSHKQKLDALWGSMQRASAGVGAAGRPTGEEAGTMCGQKLLKLLARIRMDARAAAFFTLCVL